MKEVGCVDGDFFCLHHVCVNCVDLLSLLQAIKAKQDEPKRAQRATSNVFAMFRQAQVQEFKEVWTVITV